MPTLKESISYVEIDFSAPKRVKLEPASELAVLPLSNNTHKITPPTEFEREDFFHERLPKKQKRNLIFFRSYCNMFLDLSDHLPMSFQSIFQASHLDKDYVEFLTIAHNFSG